jgi:hypothetical protein
MTDTSTDFTRNQALALRARMGVTHERAQRMMRNYLLIPRYSQQQADRVAKVVEACSALRGIDPEVVGDWDSVAHCLAHTLYHEERPWLVQWSGFMVWGREDFAEAMELVFGNRFAGEPFIERLDSQGDAMLVTAAPY